MSKGFYIKCPKCGARAIRSSNDSDDYYCGSAPGFHFHAVPMEKDGKEVLRLDLGSGVIPVAEAGETWGNHGD